MAKSQAAIGYGTLMRRGVGDANVVTNPLLDTYATVAEVTNITPPQAVSDDIEVTHNESPGRTKEYIAGLIEAGEASFTCNWLPHDPSQDEINGLLADQQNGTSRNFLISFSTPYGTLLWYFQGYVKSFNPQIPTADKMTAEVSIKVSGKSLFV